MKDKIDLIDTMLNNDDALNEYINLIQEDDIEVPPKLNSKILKYIDGNTSKNKTYKFVDILKIAACTILSVLLWETIMINPPDLTTNKEESINEDVQDNTHNSNFLINANDLCIKLNNFMFKPISFERREE